MAPLLTEDAPRPCLVEGAKALADARPARPIAHVFAHRRERLVDIALAEPPRDVREARA